MGNTVGKSEMKTWAVSQRVHMDHDRMVELRDACLLVTKSPSVPLTRLQLRQCLEKTGVSFAPDGEIILDLFTMWDVNHLDQVPQVPFLLSLCPLACQPEETLRSFLRFVLEFQDVEKTGFIVEKDLIQVLETVNTTVSLLGDSPLSKKRIYNVTYEVVGSTALIGKESAGEKMSLNDVVNVLAFDPSIRKCLSQDRTKRRVTFCPELQDETEDRDASTSSLRLDSSSTEEEMTPREMIAHEPPSDSLRERANSDETWEAEHPGYPRFTETDETVSSDTPKPNLLDIEAQCILGMGVVCLPMLLVL
uniref:EF-hand domain-containing protein n=1 Tax=Entomoneis paludosa TaxID=265537 RepID=A0A7S2YNV2_9STRA|mmetsp:Transcript_40467/g.84208  ORF Transcript_40467/g.84208 Transcript_40467/m.84208 type:complete len:306 (+) Transcript_40467:137-1054(+)|eukprot:CAMPEP_0172441858 /NCGR_PEP_ID=MMETSP1065-20121228/2372_1 /TAXON_ID=265537 /ORGANISM="Amphiprora paludosa, Strain CCMP125" /LENGTH=305 /DNA_ID=CAMNT_0013191453 /DNA_START=123 /DNA_END=1040 /DNA_ORIENTATION=+